MTYIILVFISVFAGAIAALFWPWWIGLYVLAPTLFVFVMLHIYWVKVVRKRPILAAILSNCSYGVIFTSSAAATFCGVVLANWIPDLVGNSASPNAEAVGKVLTGAVSALVGGLWLDDARSKDGQFWAPTRYKSALKVAYEKVTFFNVPLGGQRSQALEVLFSVLYDDATRDGAIKGWGFTSRIKRAAQIHNLDPEKGPNAGR